MLSVFCAHESWVLWAFSASTSANRTIFLFHKHKHGSVQYAHVYVCVRARTCVCAYVEGAHTQTAHACKEQCNSFIIIIEKWKLTKMTNRTEKKNIKQFRATTNRSSFQLSILRIKEGKKRGKIQLWEDHLNATKRLIVLEKKKCWQGTNNLHITIILQLWGR